MQRVLGEVRQNGYVVRDILRAMKYWTETLGVGPFFYMERAPIENFHYRGAPSDATISMALTNSGRLQIELVQPRDDAPSMYHDYLAKAGEGLQHVACWTETYDDDLQRYQAAGLEIVQWGQSSGQNGRFSYLTSPDRPELVVELSEVMGRKAQVFAAIAEASRTWDGTNPIRTAV